MGSALEVGHILELCLRNLTSVEERENQVLLWNVGAGPALQYT